MSTIEAELPTDDAPARTPARRTGWRSLPPLLLRLHFYAGILVGPFLLVAAFTGLLYIFTPQLEQLVYDRELHVPAGAGTQSLAAQVTAARAVHPAGQLSAIRPAPSPTDTTQVVFADPALPASYARTVFVDPHTNEIRGELVTYGASQVLPLRAWLDELHRNLQLGDVGRLYSETAASWLWIVVFGGLVLWWRKRRTARSLIVPDGRASGRRRTLSWHAVVGVWVSVVLVFLSATGLSWSQFAGGHIDVLRSALRWETPTVATQPPHHGGHSTHTGARDVGPDRALAAARAAGLSDPVYISMTKGAYVIKQTQRSWPEKQDAVAVDAASGVVIDVVRFADYPFGAKLTRWGIDAHMGLLFGLPNQIVLAIAVCGLIAMILLGYRMWWQRRPTRAGFGRPMPRGGWHGVPLALLLLLAVVAGAVGWFLPLVGVPLLGFLLLDTVIGRVRGRGKTADRIAS